MKLSSPGFGQQGFFIGVVKKNAEIKCKTAEMRHKGYADNIGHVGQ